MASFTLEVPRIRINVGMIISENLSSTFISIQDFSIRGTNCPLGRFFFVFLSHKDIYMRGDFYYDAYIQLEKTEARPP
jgi:hypothetical protein